MNFFQSLQKNPPYELHLGRLQFRDPAVENSFRNLVSRSRVFQSRVAIWSALFMYPAFLGIDYYLMNEGFMNAVAIRLGMLGMLVPMIILSLNTEFSNRHVDLMTTTGVGAIQGGHFLLMLFTDAPPYYEWGVTATIMVVTLTFARIGFERGNFQRRHYRHL